jgi:16S rRNA (guanine1207-N2)-methyltransferase
MKPIPVEEESLSSQSVALYRQSQVLEGELGDALLTLETRPGFAGWEAITPAQQLLAAEAEIGAGERVLILPCGHGALGVWLASETRADEGILLDTNIVAVQVAQRNLEATRATRVSARAGLPGDVPGPFDVVLMTLPKGRELARLHFLAAYRALREGGRLYLAGANKEGIKSTIKDAEALFGPSMLLAYRRSNRVVQFIKEAREEPLPEMYRVPGMEAGTYAHYDITVQGSTYAIRSRPGVFSWHDLDPGTAMLLDVLEVHPSDEVLDVGTGYGIIGLHVAQRIGAEQVTLVDVDLLAVESAKETLRANHMEGVEVVLGDGVAAAGEREFSLIVSNPPFHSGHAQEAKMVQALIAEAFAALRPRGRLVLVANRFLPYNRSMERVFGSVETLAQDTRYHVLSATKRYQRKARGKPPKARRQDAGDAGEETIYEIES